MLRALYNGELDGGQMIVSLFAYLMVLFLIQPLHECAHAWMAHKMGDDTAKDAGRLTLNPFRHLDLAGTFSMLIFGFGWGKPVPVDSSNFEKPRKGIGLTSVAGPVSNFLAAFLGMIGKKIAEAALLPSLPEEALYDAQALKIALSGNRYYYLYYFFLLFTTLNIGLAVFNLIPVPPLDGSGVFLWVMPRKVTEKYYAFARKYSQFMPMLLFALMFTPVLGWIQDGAFWVLDKMTFFMDIITQKAF